MDSLANVDSKRKILLSAGVAVLSFTVEAGGEPV